MRKKWLIIFGAVFLAVALATVGFAASPIKLIVNGQEIKPDVPPQITNGRTVVPVRWVAEALGANVEWDGQEDTVLISKAEISQQEIELISNYLRQAENPEDFIKNFAKALQNRNGAVARLFLSPDIRSQIKSEVIGTSTPIREVKVIEQPMIENNTFRYTLQAFYTPYGEVPASLAFEIVVDVEPDKYDNGSQKPGFYFITKFKWARQDNAEEGLRNSTENQDMKITMYLEKTKYNLPINEITLQIKNPEAISYQFGQYYTIEIYQDNAWHKIPFKKNTGFHDVLYTLEPGKTHSQVINLQGLDYEITKGKYRICKDFDSNGNKITLETEFNID